MAIKIPDTLRPDNGTYPIVDSQDIKGGLKGVNTKEELALINSALLSPGMLVWVAKDSCYYNYVNGAWEEFIGGSVGLQILTTPQINLLREKNKLPEKYIWCRSGDELLGSGEIEDYTYKTSVNGTYTDVLFKAVKQLQLEVAKMRNAFKYGMYSMTGKETAMSTVIEELAPKPEDEPLWAIEEDGLLYLSQVSFDEAVPNLVTSSPLLIDGSSQKYYDINTRLNETSDVYWDDVKNNEEGSFASSEDPKLFIYLTVSTPAGAKDFDFNINLATTDKEPKTLSNIKIDGLVPRKAQAYNIMLLLNRKQQKNGELYGSNYLYISISDWFSNEIIASGYWNKTDGRLYSSIQELGEQYIFNRLYFGNIRLSKLTCYSRYQDFTQQVMPMKPNDEDYRYKVAHITIRSVADEEELKSIKQYLPNNELIWEEANSVLWIKTNDKVAQIGGTTSKDPENNNNNDTMTQAELINALKEMGIVYESANGLDLKDISDVTFVNQNLSEKYVYSVDSEGQLHSSVVPSESLKKLVEDKQLYKDKKPGSTLNIRGFVANLRASEPTKSGAILNESDRIHISQFYAPLTTDIRDGKIGCSHAFIELTNTSTLPFPLDGCFIHYYDLTDDGSGECKYFKMELKGVINPGSTYLIRGKKYADYKNANVFIKVDSYDMEWFTSKDTLIDLVVDPAHKSYGIALTYGDTVNDVAITPTSLLVTKDNDGTVKYLDNYIDSIIYAADSANIPQTYRTWATWQKGYKVQSNSLFRESFLLDPAKQGFQALQSAKKDTSRYRHEKDTDFSITSLANEFIEFPKSNLVKAVSDFTPKASYLGKTVITEKSNIDLNKPNMITCSFGINMFTTRCFNWISGGIFDEFIWIREKGQSEWAVRYESYTTADAKCGVVGEKTSTSITKKTIADDAVKAAIYDRITGIFPGTKTEYTAHKVIINLPTPSSTKEYEYCVGRSLLNGNPDPTHSNVNDLYTFKMYPNNYKPHIYQTSDQQGFWWVEYQVWAGAAEELDKHIASKTASNEIPVLINTGDMTQSGARISEWFDYYEAGKTLFKHLEQMNVVGNNDLANIDPTVLGTGDDAGKSNSFYFHVFYCYEVDDFGGTAYPVVNGKYIPSLYYFGTPDYRIIMINSEITSTTCSGWFNIGTHNIYTGYDISTNTYKTDGSWTPIYDRLYAIMNNFTGKQFITVCHEMPFTVITKANISKADDIVAAQRSASGTSLVGSHLNSITAADTGYGFNWFSRLLEFFAGKGKTKLCIGGHKHTYAMTFPIRENYTYTNGTVKDSKDGPMPMSATLNNDIEHSVKWTKELYFNATTCTYQTDAISGVTKQTVHTSKLPYIPVDVKSYTYNGGNTIANASAKVGFLPYVYLNTLNTSNAITYFMCQATGYKYSSNKELPAYTQAFSELIPKTKETEKPSDEQKYPMFCEYTFDNSAIACKLARIKNIFNTNALFTQSKYGTDANVIEYIKGVSNSLYGSWTTTVSTIKTL